MAEFLLATSVYRTRVSEFFQEYVIIDSETNDLLHEDELADLVGYMGDHIY